MELAILLQVATAISALLAVAASVYIMRAQISSAKEIALKQISQARNQADKQIASTVLSTNRQAWINELRTTVANFIVSVNHLRTTRHIPEEHRSVSEIVASTDNCWLQLNKIKLLINPSEDVHNRLVELTEEFYRCITVESADFQSIEGTLIAHAQRVLKAEWERVKQLV
jgi:vacuolar-type H+-ATPase subunit E/Vma4